MVASILNPLARCLSPNFASASLPSISRYFGPNCAALQVFQENIARNYSKKSRSVCDGCRRAFKDIPDPGDPECPLSCEGRRKKKKGILHKIKLKIIEGGTNFGTPFRRLRGIKQEGEPEDVSKEEEPAQLPAPQEEVPFPDPRPGVQVSVLGADTAVGQYVSLLLKQCPQINRLRLYQSREENCTCPPSNITNPCRNMFNIVQDLQHIDTNCTVEAFSCTGAGDLEACLRNSDIVLMLESGYANVNMPFEKRFESQAPIVKRYADAIAQESPKAMVIVCISPVDCMVPLVAETMKETGWHDKRKLIGSMAVPEMRASTLAARALSLEPRYTRVPCVGGTEGEALVPLFSKAVTYFDFARHNAELLTNTVRMAPLSVARCECSCMRNADLSEAHALAGMVKSVSHALLCQDIPRISGFVETDASQVISPARFIGNTVELNGSGIVNNLGLPSLSENEIRQVHLALKELHYKLMMVYDWYCKFRCLTVSYDGCKTTDWFSPKPYKHFGDSEDGSVPEHDILFLPKNTTLMWIYVETYLALDLLVNRHGVCKKFDFPAPMSNFELELMDSMWGPLAYSVSLAQDWFRKAYADECYQKNMKCIKNFHTPTHYHHLNSCDCHLVGN